MNKSKIKECKYRESLEISPIKVLSHSTNKIIKSAANCTLIEVFDETSDKENKEIDNFSKKKNSKKVLIPSRYQSNSIEKKETNSSNRPKKLIPKNSVHNLKKEVESRDMKKNPGKATLQSNLLPHQKKSRPIPSDSKTIFHPVRVSSNANKSSDEVIKNESMEKPIFDGTAEKAESNKITQTTLDIAYCQYLQCCFLKQTFDNVLKEQEIKFSKAYKKLINEDHALTGYINKLQLYNEIDRNLNQREYVAEKLSKVFNSDLLKNITKQLESCVDLVEVDQRLDVIDIDNSDLNKIINYIDKELKVNNEDIDVTFENLNSNLVNINDKFTSQNEELKTLKENCIKLLPDVLSSVKNLKLNN